ncbi:aspartate carbamoyltransferase [Halobacillus andaensis]|uniref:Aspartate carbamoyltransferase n=1 Tax=Halobacillus andaensis TaxID=1176239 RepID=A0A917EVB7_HALAA|nr:aspartate carbamoyltransferase catalytic subunit [Halobacillus andaensis]MBP2003560.1 aspartate carbamoyltransferase catalytic subunit [Halobacillus andaensis]GGF11564.1 aspartate carbamoyltransferase [Halobacillus andaensis]
MQHLLSVNELTSSDIQELFLKAKQIKEGDDHWCAPQAFAANIFLEPSTRTKNSFYIAEKRLGIDVVDVNGSDSSLTKGESLRDTLKTLESIGVQLAVLRQSEQGILQELTKDLRLSIINAGDGIGEHPTQSLLDLFTISEEFTSFEGLHVTIAGDIKHSRVARSNACALKKLGAEVSFVAPDEWKDPTLGDNYISMDEAVETSDVLMLLRVQCERHEQPAAYDDYLSTFGLTVERERRMKKDSIILHPAPVNRGVEIDSSLVECPRSRIFQQMTNGVAIRMAIIQTLLQEEC